MRKLVVILAVLFGVIMLFGAIYALVGKKPIVSPGKVAIVRIEGPIIDSREAVSELKSFAEDSSVKAIVLRVDSPGGAVAPSQEIYTEVKKAAERKKVVVSMGSLAASGGYYVSSPATTIVANPGTITGSIGVIMEIPNFEGLMDKIGVKTTVVKSGKFKDIGSATKELTPEERRLLQEVMDDVHEQFIRAVAEGRGMAFEDVAKLADGRIFSGEQAKELGLVDELGGLEDSIALSARMAGIKGKPEVVEHEEKIGLLDLLLNGKLAGRLTNMSETMSIKYLFNP
ncbi:MAG: signal peptide peptidase SppA [Nitrospirota bacterium]